MDPFILIGAITGVSGTASAAAAHVANTRTKVRLVREALDGVPPAEKPAVLEALAAIL
ncbi:hypothetical protein GCM10009764_78330 [Nocardia ninae]|uniref:Uncharacterized protein n=1 Tax=Nocardia ninae NBRC 108245 TaxID=1210091 RepID=A0A511MF40_9NOCA|nr:hypothetical protein NN4_29950 [Nocardia ninae NBRC 108245]